MLYIRLIFSKSSSFLGYLGTPNYFGVFAWRLDIFTISHVDTPERGRRK